VYFRCKKKCLQGRVRLGRGSFRNLGRRGDGSWKKGVLSAMSQKGGKGFYREPPCAVYRKKTPRAALRGAEEKLGKRRFSTLSSSQGGKISKTKKDSGSFSRLKNVLLLCVRTKEREAARVPTDC